MTLKAKYLYIGNQESTRKTYKTKVVANEKLCKIVTFKGQRS